jgi:8-oxo-dGTP pyrophosphatase MutT (NUDIX family)
VSFSLDDFRERVARAEGLSHDIIYGDHRLNPEFQEALAGSPLRDAAVLIGLQQHGDEVRVILTQRTEQMRKHAGQVAFPGGAIDDDDLSHHHAALREAEEEIGLKPDDVEVIGQLPDYLTGSGFRIKPVLGLVSANVALTINPDEVAAVFDVPLSFLMDPANHQRQSRVWQGIERHYYVIQYEDRMIWGVTAGIVRMLYERFYA